MSQAQKEAREQYLTEKQASDMTGISVNTFQNWRVLGRGPGFVKPVGRCVRYPLSKVIAFMEERGGGGES